MNFCFDWPTHGFTMESVFLLMMNFNLSILNSGRGFGRDIPLLLPKAPTELDEQLWEL